jgi:hypothetical protein
VEHVIVFRNQVVERPGTGKDRGGFKIIHDAASEVFAFYAVGAQRYTLWRWMAKKA